MMMFLLGLVAGVLLGGFVIDINMRAPAPLKKWLSSWFPSSDEPTA
jgi:xanthosine utilization system XapX-like protein